ncbi:hypothetical protein AYO38_10835 [bacterium SCGC AG-212-C10]|nr:hypothetical protein AYO38_10835 [bacterium SCGC AG-212-C10]
MPLYVAYLAFKPGTNPLMGLQAFERRKTFEHPHMATVLGEYWVNAPEGMPQVVLVWEAEDEAAGDYYEAAWGDLFDITISLATRPVSELPESFPDAVKSRLG